jgi:hypothetical protein
LPDSSKMYCIPSWKTGESGYDDNETDGPSTKPPSITIAFPIPSIVQVVHKSIRKAGESCLHDSNIPDDFNSVVIHIQLHCVENAHCSRTFNFNDLRENGICKCNEGFKKTSKQLCRRYISSSAASQLNTTFSVFWVLFKMLFVNYLFYEVLQLNK